jgi:hypothetical protein
MLSVGAQSVVEFIAVQLSVIMPSGVVFGGAAYSLKPVSFFISLPWQTGLT